MIRRQVKMEEKKYKEKQLKGIEYMKTIAMNSTKMTRLMKKNEKD